MLISKAMIFKPKMIEAYAGYEIDRITETYKTSMFLSAVLRRCKREKEITEEQ